MKSCVHTLVKEELDTFYSPLANGQIQPVILNSNSFIVFGQNKNHYLCSSEILIETEEIVFLEIFFGGHFEYFMLITLIM